MQLSCFAAALATIVFRAMPRALTLGNGDLLINFDARYNLVDIYWPYVGRENQTDGHICRMGV